MSNPDKDKMVGRYLRGVRRQEKRQERRDVRKRRRDRDSEPPEREVDRFGDGDDSWREDLGDWEALADEPLVPGGDSPRRGKGKGKGSKSRRRKRAKGETDTPPTDRPDRGVQPPVADQPGRVVTIHRDRVELATLNGVTSAVLPKELRNRQHDGLAVGDFVRWQERPDAVARVVEVEPRTRSLSRPDPGNRHRQRVLVANVDRAVIVLACVAPGLRPALVDRMLVALSVAGVTPVLCINKLDLADAHEVARVTALRATYSALGVPCFATSAETGDGLDALHAELRGRTSVFLGHSGVGKSALLNSLDPEGARAIGSGREFDGKGRHTTRGSRLAVLDDAGTAVIDTPGVRAFGLWKIDPLTLARHFPDFRGLPPCQFGDCVHDMEPGCSVREAMDSGALGADRFAAYERLAEGLEEAL